MKKLIVLVVVIILVFSTTVFAQNIEVLLNYASVIVNGKLVTEDTILYNGRVYVPIRTISESLNKEVTWDGNTKNVLIRDRLTLATTPTSTPTPVIKPIQKATERIQNIYDDCKVSYDEELSAIYLIDINMNAVQNLYILKQDIEFWDNITSLYIDISINIAEEYDFVIGTSDGELMFVIKNGIVKYDWARDEYNKQEI